MSFHWNSLKYSQIHNNKYALVWFNLYILGCTTHDQLGSQRPIDGDGDGDGDLAADCDVGAIEYSDLIFVAGFE